MAITISGENNNDRILAADGVIDQISGINIVGLITASHINVGSNIQLGNAGIITATTFVGNVTGNVNSTSPLLLQTGGSERFRITGDNALGIAGANYGSSGQVLTSGGSGSAVSWATPAITGFTAGSNNRVVTATSGSGLNGEANLIFDGSSLGVGTTPETDGQTGSIYFAGGNANIWGSGNANIYTAVNARYTGAGGWKYNNNGVASYVGQQSGVWNFFNAPSGSADATATFTERLRITSDGIIETGTAIDDSAYDGNQRLRVGRTGDCSISIRANGSTTAATGLDFGDDDDDRAGRIQYVHNGNYMSFHTNGAGTGSANEQIRITSVGRVGIDRTSPNTMLDIKVPPLDTATITTTNCLQLGLLLTAGGTGSNTEGHIYNGLAVGDGYAGLYGKDGGSSAATDLEFFTGNSSAVAGRMRIQDDGKIIIGGNVAQSINRSVSVVAASGNSQSVEIGLQPTNSSGGYNPEVYISSVADGTYGAQIGFHTRNTSGARAERFGISSSGNIRWRSGAVLQRKTGAFLGISGADTSDVKICGNFENNDMIRVRWSYNWNAGDGGAWGEAIIWKMYEGTKKVRYLTDVKASPLTSVSFPHSGNDVWLRWQTNAGINGYYMIDVETHGCEPFPF